jgi:hypothetical protein
MCFSLQTPIINSGPSVAQLSLGEWPFPVAPMPCPYLCEQSSHRTPVLLAEAFPPLPRSGYSLPEFHHGTGHIGGIGNAVVGEAALCVPGVVTLFPWQCLQGHSHTDESKAGQRGPRRLCLPLWSPEPLQSHWPTSPSQQHWEAGRPVIPIL